MSTRYNNLFQRDPFRFINSYTIEIKKSFEGLTQNREESRKDYIINKEKSECFGCFDFEPVREPNNRGINSVEFSLVQKGGIDAFCLSCAQRVGIPVYIDVLRKDPPFHFIFTLVMNDSEFVVMDSPKGKKYMRVFQHQHPENNHDWETIDNIGNKIISSAGFDTYAGEERPNVELPMAFNFLYYRNGEWHYGSQPQSFTTSIPARRLSWQSSTRPVLVDKAFAEVGSMHNGFQSSKGGGKTRGTRKKIRVVPQWIKNIF